MSKKKGRHVLDMEAEELPLMNTKHEPLSGKVTLFQTFLALMNEYYLEFRSGLSFGHFHEK